MIGFSEAIAETAPSQATANMAKAKPIVGAKHDQKVNHSRRSLIQNVRLYLLLIV
jgi:hypothetical protein